MKKYCVHVSPQMSQPFSRAWAIGSIASLQETWTTYSGAPATRARWIAPMGRLALGLGGPRQRVPVRLGVAVRERLLTRTSIASPCSACTITSAPVSAATCMTRKSVSSSTMIAPL